MFLENISIFVICYYLLLLLLWKCELYATFSGTSSVLLFLLLLLWKCELYVTFLGNISMCQTDDTEDNECSSSAEKREVSGSQLQVWIWR